MGAGIIAQLPPAVLQLGLAFDPWHHNNKINNIAAGSN